MYKGNEKEMNLQFPPEDVQLYESMNEELWSRGSQRWAGQVIGKVGQMYPSKAVEDRDQVKVKPAKSNEEKMVIAVKTMLWRKPLDQMATGRGQCLKLSKMRVVCMLKEIRW